MAEDKSRGFNAARLSVCKHSYFFILFMIISWGLIKTLGRREGAGKIKGLRRGGFGPRRRAAGPAGPATLLFAPLCGANGWATRPA